MNSRRDFPQDQYGRGRDEERSFSRDQHRGGQYRGQQGWRGSGSPDWDFDSREGAQYGASQDRFGGYSGSMNYGNPYEPRQQQSDWSRQNQWDEDRFGYPESGSYGREMSRTQNPGYGPQGRFGEDRYSWGRQYGQNDMERGGRPYGSFDQPRHFEPRQSSGWGSWSQGSSGGGSGESFAGGRSSYGGDRHQGGVFGGWGIPSGSELGGYGMNNPSRGGEPQNWSGSNWGNQGGSQWGGGHSGRFGGDQGYAMRGRTPKGYTRSDERIKDDVCEQLYRTPDIDVSEVTVEARNGTVTLEGTVPDRRMKHRIEDLCEQCIGVKDVENRIRVQREDRGAMESRFGSEEDRSNAGTSGTNERSTKKSSTGTSSSQH